MKRCKKQKWIVPALYGELNEEDKRIFDNHLQECQQCSAEYDRLKSTLELMDKKSAPEPSEAFWEGYWDRLSPKLSGSANRQMNRAPQFWKFIKSLRPEPVWTYRLAGAIAILILGIFIGKLYYGRPVPVPVSPAASGRGLVQNAAAEAEAQQYLDRARVLLLGIMNTDPEKDSAVSSDFSYRQKVSREMIRQAANLKEELRSPEERRLKELIKELETILMQIANLESQNNLDAVEVIRDGINHQGILFKINLESMRQNMDQPSQGTGSSGKISS